MGKKLTQGEFIARAQEVHGHSRYDYSRVLYEHFNKKVWVGCSIHTDFWFEITPNAHLNQKQGCTKCGGNYRLTLCEFIAKSMEVHGADIYDYSRVVDMSTRKVQLGCNNHPGYWFLVKPANHINRKTGCSKCAGNYRRDTTDFISESKAINSDRYNYSRCTYTNQNTEVVLGCNIHTDYWFGVLPSNHLHKNAGCDRCAGNYSPSTDEFIIKSKLLFGEAKFDYSNCVYSSAHRKVKLRCMEHDHHFSVIADDHIHKMVGCIKCTVSGTSKKQIQWLKFIETAENIVIQHAMNDGEFKIQAIGMVDGYCKETNTVYEFHGDYWHGHPIKYNQGDVNPVNKKTYGELYQKTLARDQKIRDLGYNLVVIWEHAWNKIEKENKKLLNAKI